MEAVEKITGRLSLYGRFVDEVTRRFVPYHDYEVRLKAPANRDILYKEDGYFAIADLQPSTNDYEFVATASIYQPRELAKRLPTLAAVEVTYPGEDELYVSLIGPPDTANRTVPFQPIPFLPTIPADSRILGPSGFETLLSDPLEGEDVQSATLNDVGGLAQGHLLRIIRSPDLLLRPGPYHPFPAGTSVALLTIAEDTATAAPIGDALIQITHANSVLLSTAVVGAPPNSLQLWHVTLSGRVVVLGPELAVTTLSNSRGHAVFYFPSNVTITSITVSIQKDGYVPESAVVTVNTGERATQTIKLVRT